MSIIDIINSTSARDSKQTGSILEKACLKQENLTVHKISKLSGISLNSDDLDLTKRAIQANQILSNAPTGRAVIKEASLFRYSQFSQREQKTLNEFESEESQALVIGVWQPGTPGKVVTLALDYHCEEAKDMHQKNPNYVPDFQGDFMTMDLGTQKYSRIIFQGVCPVNTAMGAPSCDSNWKYDSVDPSRLARKVRDLISKGGGHVFFRHCVGTACLDKNKIERIKTRAPQNLDKYIQSCIIENREKRERFIKSFLDEGFTHIQEFHPPGDDIPDPHPNCKEKWLPLHGALTFYKSGE